MSNNTASTTSTINAIRGRAQQRHLVEQRRRTYAIRIGIGVIAASLLAILASGFDAAVSDTGDRFDDAAIIRVGEYMTDPFDAVPGDIIIEHYDVRATGDHIIRKCNESGGQVVFDHIVGFNGYACRGLDF